MMHSHEVGGSEFQGAGSGIWSPHVRYKHDHPIADPEHAHPVTLAIGGEGGAVTTLRFVLGANEQRFTG